MGGWLAIVNPRAGQKHSANWRAAMSARLTRALNAQVVFTERPGHAQEIAATAGAFEGLAVFGGDGTTAEVVNGMDCDRQLLLVLAGGTGNSLARDLGLTRLDSALTAARENRRRTLDLIRITFHSAGQPFSRLAISTASVGYAAEVVVIANRYFKSLGPLCYPLAATLQAVRQRAFRSTVGLDGASATEQQLSNIMINNTIHAGNFRAFRGADLNDGKMEVLLARAGFIPQFLHNLAVLTRTYFYATAAEINARDLTLRLPTPQCLMIDGELWQSVTEVHFEILPGRLQCVA